MEEIKTIKIGEKIPEFTLEAYYPDKKRFW